MRRGAINIPPLRGADGGRLVLFIFLLAQAVAPPAAAESQFFIRINQLGYRPLDAKVALAFARADLPQKFFALDAVTRQTVFEGSTKSISGRWGEFDHYAELDFSRLRRPGKYFLRIGDTESSSFEIRDDVYDHVPDELLEFMREQRGGYNPYVDAVCHSFDGRSAFGPTPAGT